MDAKHILIVEDDQDLTDMLEDILAEAGYTVAIAFDADQCFQAIENEPPDLIILDINLNLPDINGLDLCRELKKLYPTPILILSGSNDEVDKIVALELGAHNYLTKPVGTRLLLTYIRTTLQQSMQLASREDKQQGPVKLAAKLLCFDRFVMNLDSFTLSSSDGEDIPISSAEFKVLQVLAEHPRHVLSRRQFLDYIQASDEIFERSIDRFICYLRKKIEADPKNPVVIKSIYGEGYLFDVEVRRETV